MSNNKSTLVEEQALTEGWREHSFAKDIQGVKRAEKALRKKGWEVMAVKTSSGWKVYIREGKKP